MKYLFCDLIIEIQDFPAYLMERYAGFRVKTKKEADILIRVEQSEKIEIPNSEPIYQFDTWLKIYADNGTESRYYFDCISGKLKAYYRNIGNDRVLTLTKNDTDSLLSELEIINTLGLEAVLSEKGRFILHSSYIKTSKGAILFTAPSGTGKSTQASLWEKYKQAEVINGDRTIVWNDDGKWMAGSGLWCGTSGIMRNEQYPLRAIIMLEQGPNNTVIPMRIAEKLSKLLEQTTINQWNTKMFQAASNLWMECIVDVPVLKLSCKPDKEAVECLEVALKEYEDGKC